MTSHSSRNLHNDRGGPMLSATFLWGEIVFAVFAKNNNAEDAAPLWGSPTGLGVGGIPRSSTLFSGAKEA